jgi:Cu-Zn family superoxide dismutase
MKNALALGLILATMVSCSHSAKKETEATSASATPTATLPAPTRAQAVLKAANGEKVKGIIHFTEENGTMKVETMVEGLKSGPHGFHIHEVGDCSKADFASAGGHFNVNNSQHGSVTGDHRHAGDLGNLMANGKGVAKTSITVSGITLAPGANSILGRAVIIHKDKDDFKSQPAGNSGARQACGIIEAL